MSDQSRRLPRGLKRDRVAREKKRKAKLRQGNQNERRNERRRQATAEWREREGIVKPPKRKFDNAPSNPLGETTYWALVPADGYEPDERVFPLELSRYPSHLRSIQERFSQPTRIVPASTRRFIRDRAAIFWRGAELDAIASR